MDNPATRVPLVLLPGLLCDARVFAPVLGRIGARDATVDTLDGAPDVPALARRILAAAPPRFALLGFSLGGIVAIEVAAQAPDRVRGLALVGANARPVASEEQAARRAESRAGAADLPGHLRRRLWPSYVAAAHRSDAALRALIFAMAAAAGPVALVAQTELGLTRRDGRALLSGLAMPALVMGGAEDVRCPPGMQRELAAGLPDAELVLVPGAGHLVLLEAPVLAAAHLARWLERVDRAS